MKSYFVEEAQSNIVVFGEIPQTGYVVYFYDEDRCLWSEFFVDKEYAEEYGNAYLNSDWDVKGFPVTVQYNTAA